MNAKNGYSKLWPVALAVAAGLLAGCSTTGSGSSTVIDPPAPPGLPDPPAVSVPNPPGVNPPPAPPVR